MVQTGSENDAAGQRQVVHPCQKYSCFVENQILNTAVLRHLAEGTVNWKMHMENTHTAISDPGDEHH